jgi:site-specific DNA-methyltransferase (adenine-specific)
MARGRPLVRISGKSTRTNSSGLRTGRNRVTQDPPRRGLQKENYLAASTTDAQGQAGIEIKPSQVYQGDCLKVMPRIKAKSVALIVCDLPYGVTRHPEDKVIDLELLWKEYTRILKDDGVVVLTSQFPFTLDLINSNRSMFKYDLIWNKVLISGFLNVNRRPLRVHEHILVFYKKLGTYNPQTTSGAKSHSKGKAKTNANNNYGEHGFVDHRNLLGTRKYPQSILTIPKPHPSIAAHRTEKPVELAEYLVKTYSNEGDLVLDNCLGSGWTAVACKRHNRNFIGIELRKDFVAICNQRLRKVRARHRAGGHSNHNAQP